MSEQSDTPRTTQLLMSLPAEIVARQLERELATATRQLDEALVLNAKWAEKAETWTASPEAAQRLQGYRELGKQVAKAQNELDEARAALRAIKLEAVSLADAQVIALEALSAT